MKSGVDPAGSKPSVLVHELRLDRARAQRGRRDSGALQVAAEHLGEREHERLRGRIRALPRQRLEAGGRCHVQDGALAALDHRRHVFAAEVDDRLDVRAHHPQLAVEVEVLEAARRCRSPRCSSRPPPRARAPGSRAISRSRAASSDKSQPITSGAHVQLRLDLLRERRQAILAARDERHAVAALGQLARDVGADARRGPGDQGGRVCGWRRQRHGPPAYNQRHGLRGSLRRSLRRPGRAPAAHGRDRRADAGRAEGRLGRQRDQARRRHDRRRRSAG